MDFLLTACRICRCRENLCDLTNQVNEDAARKLATVTTIRIQSDELLPRSLCGTCIGTLNVVYNFLQQCEAAEQRLQEVLRQEPCRHDGDNEIFIKEEPLDMMEDQLLLNETTGNISPEDRMDPEEDRKDIVLEEAKVVEPTQRNESEDQKFFCKKCGSGFEKATELQNHAKIHVRAPPRPLGSDEPGKRTILCQSCPNSYKTSGGLRRHVQSAHLGQKPFACDICGKAFSQKTVLVAHHTMHIQERNYPCEVCSSRFKSKKQLKEHLERHVKSSQPKQPTDPLECDVCHKLYSDKQLLRKHKLTHLDANFMCTFCGMTFKIMGRLKVHLRTHTKEQPYECNVCHKKFSHGTSLKSHQLMHWDERPYKCDLCDMAFRQVNHLKSHKVLHTGERPFECVVCRKAFAFQKHLTVHMRIHKDPAASPFQCRVCVGKRLNDSNALKRHLKAHPNAKVVKTGPLTVIVDEGMAEEQESSEVKVLIKKELSDMNPCLNDC